MDEDNMARVTVEAAVPRVTTRPERTVVACGKTEVVVSEYGNVGSKDWAVWSPGAMGKNVRNQDERAEFFKDNGGPGRAYPLDLAMADARKHVRQQETRRLLHNALVIHLDAFPDGP